MRFGLLWRFSSNTNSNLSYTFKRNHWLKMAKRLLDGFWRPVQPPVTVSGNQGLGAVHNLLGPQLHPQWGLASPDSANWANWQPPHHITHCCQLQPTQSTHITTPGSQLIQKTLLNITFFWSSPYHEVDQILQKAYWQTAKAKIAKIYREKHCQRHNGLEGWVHITSSYTNPVWHDMTSRA